MSCPVQGREGESGEVEPSQMMPARETERMMKLQDVILKAMARKLTWIQAAEIAGMAGEINGEVSRSGDVAPTPITVVLNWTAGLKK